MSGPITPCRTTITNTLEFAGTIPVAQLSAWLGDLPDDAELTFHQGVGNAREPGRTVLTARCSRAMRAAPSLTGLRAQLTGLGDGHD